MEQASSPRQPEEITNPGLQVVSAFLIALGGGSYAIFGNFTVWEVGSRIFLGLLSAAILMWGFWPHNQHGGFVRVVRVPVPNLLMKVIRGEFGWTRREIGFVLSVLAMLASGGFAVFELVKINLFNSGSDWVWFVSIVAFFVFAYCCSKTEPSCIRRGR